MDFKLNKREGNYPSKFTPERVCAILSEIDQGIPYRIAAEANGVHRNTFQSWVYQGLFDIEHGVESDYVELVVSLRGSESKRIKSCLADIRSADKSHKGAEWTLERCFWKDFSSNVSNIELMEKVNNIEKILGKKSNLTGVKKNEINVGSPQENTE